MPIMICATCRRPVVNSFHCFSEWCTCPNANGDCFSSNVNPNQLRLIRGEKVDVSKIDNYVDWSKMHSEMKERVMREWNGKGKYYFKI